MDLDRNRLFVKHILDNATKFEWSLQGLGMLRLYLSNEVRLHIWDENYAVKNVSKLHTHPWNFVSEVVVGEIANYLYEDITTQCNILNVPQSNIYNSQVIKCGVGGGLCGLPKNKVLKFVGDYFYVAGKSYAEDHNTIHMTAADNGSITLVTRKFLANTEHAEVFWPAGEEWVSAEPRKATEQEVWNITQNSLKKYFSR